MLLVDLKGIIFGQVMLYSYENYFIYHQWSSVDGD